MPGPQGGRSLIWTYRSTALPMAPTVLALAGLTLHLTSFAPIRIEVDWERALGPEHIVRSGQSYRIEGLLDDGGNPYHQITSAYLELTSERPRSHIAWTTGDLRFDQTGRHFVVGLDLPGNFMESLQISQAYLVVVIRDRSGRTYAKGDLPGNWIAVRTQ